MFTIQRCVLILLLITVCSKARNAPEGGSRQLEEVATRRELGGPYLGTCNAACGGKSNNGNCYCDSVCSNLGDCCDDYNEQCANPSAFPGSCSLSCGSKSKSGSCWCDEVCEQYGDCCADYTHQCSCQESCYGKKASGCWCDSLCEFYSDCCPDYEVCKSSWRRELEEVATRGELENSDITETSNSPSSHPTDLPSSIPTESPTDVAADEITFDVDEERALNALERRQHAADFIQGHLKVEYDVKERQHMAEFMRETHMEAESSQRRQLSSISCSALNQFSHCSNEANEVNVSPGMTIYNAYHCTALCEAYVTDNNLNVGGCCEYQADWKKCLWVDGVVLGADSYRYAAICTLDNLGSCKNSCNGKSQNGNCWCDGACTQLGDCCNDYTSQCIVGPNSGSCVGSCGSYSHVGSCWCDSLCTYYGDCCHDYGNVCTRRELGEEENTERNGRRNLAGKNNQGGARLLKML